MWIWMCPNHIKAVLKTFFAEAPLFRLISFEITFSVTEKDQVAFNIVESLLSTWPLLLYFFACIASLIYFIVAAAIGKYSVWQLIMTATAVGWGAYICLCIWPPIALLLPRIETTQGWKISWDQTIDESKFVVDEKKRVVRRQKEEAQSQNKQRVGGDMDETFEGVGNTMYTLGDLTNNIIENFAPVYSHISEEFVSPFDIESGGVPSQNNDSSSGRTKHSHSALSMISSAISNMNFFKRSRSSEIQEVPSRGPGLKKRGLSENIGRVALPQKTANTLLGSGIYTSTILPEPSRISRADSKRVDTRHLSIEQVRSQIFSKMGSVIEDRDWVDHPDGNPISGTVPITLNFKTSFGADLNAEPFWHAQTSDAEHLHYPERSMADDSLDLHITSDGRVFKNQQEVGVGVLTENIVTQLDLRRHSSNEFSSDFLSPFFESDSSIADHAVDKDLTFTHSVHVTRSGTMDPRRQPNLNSVIHTGNLQRKETFGTQRNIQKDAQRLLSVPVTFSAQDAKKSGQEILRAMTMSCASVSQEDDGSLFPVQSARQCSIVLGDRAFEILRDRIASQPGSILLSTIFSQLSKMQPSALENAGVVLPVIPDSIFDHTIASKPSFEFRVLPSKTVMFLTINITILCGVLAGGVLSIFYSNSAV